MRLKFLLCILLYAWCAGPGGAFAQQDKRDEESDLPPGAVFRFETEDGSTEVSSSLSDEAIKQGYEVLNRNGRVIKTVEPELSEEERERLKEQKEREREQSRQKKRDKKLLRMYAGPGDARRARNRQIDALQVNISYTRNSLDGIKDKLDEEVSDAAKFERRGEEVPESTQDAIDHYQRQIKEHEKEIEQYRDDIEQVRERYQPIIDRLKEIGSKRDSRAGDKESDMPGETREEPSPPQR